MQRSLRPSLIPLLLFAAACTERTELTGPGADGAPVALAAVTSTVVMSGLNSPRGLAWGPDGSLYVAEAGTNEVNGPCIPFMEGPNLNTRCWSGTGSVSRLWKGRQERVVSGLASTVILETGFAAGPQDISLLGKGNALVAMGYGGDPAQRPDLGPGSHVLGTLLQLRPSGGWRIVADVAAFEGAVNPAGGPVDSNPYGVLAEAGISYVVDAGGNSLMAVSANGDISLVVTFPRVPVPPPFSLADAVPTKVVRGPDGALYVATLAGIPFLMGTAAVYRVVPGAPPELFAGGFKMITDLDFGPDGSLFVVQFDTAPIFVGAPGALVRITPDGTRTTLRGDLFQPTGVAVGLDGSVYVSNRGTATGTGEVIRVTF